MRDKKYIIERVKEFANDEISLMDLDDKVDIINQIKEIMHSVSPFKNEPVDFVKWVKCDDVVANDYNPNKVAPPEMELLEVSIMNDGYTQPIVTWDNKEKNKIEVIDGFHRNRVGKESKIVSQRIQGYLPIVDIRTEQSGKSDRIASTIRHNRARGKHQVDAMSEIVIELKNRNWTNKRVAKQLGMDEEEVLRLCQISGLEHLFSDRDFSNSWVAEDSNEVFTPLRDDLTPIEVQQFRVGNTNDPNRVFHTYDKWECHKAGFYAPNKKDFSNEQCEQEFIRVLTDQNLFASILDKVIIEWKNSCEHYLTNKSMNRIAWLGQAAVCYHTSVPSRYSGAWFKMSEEDRGLADETALIYLNKWMVSNGMNEESLNEASSIGRQVELY
tara:strand:+ start:1117 stop:2268 length:1152 start_codon:yes stop_codon:yes gene_type:complete